MVKVKYYVYVQLPGSLMFSTVEVESDAFHNAWNELVYRYRYSKNITFSHHVTDTFRFAYQDYEITTYYISDLSETVNFGYMEVCKNGD